jgi:sulfur carrier protein
MTVELNGERQELAEGSTLAEAVQRTGAPLGERGVAAAVDGEVVPRDEWSSTLLRDGQSVEVLRAVQGG